MEMRFRTISNEAAREAAKVFDSAVRQVLDKALGADGWTLADVPNHGELRERANRVEVLWDGKLLATIHRHQRWEETRSGPGCRWTMTLAVQQHLEAG